MDIGVETPKVMEKIICERADRERSSEILSLPLAQGWVECGGDEK